MARPKAELVLSREETERLKELARRRKTAQGVATRARIVLRCAQGKSNLQVAEELGVSNLTVGKWRQRFIERRLDGLVDAPRCGAPRSVNDRKIEKLVTATLEEAPKGATHWSTRTMAKRMGVSHMTVQRVWNAFRLQPHRSETFTLSNDPCFIEKVRDVVGLYVDPPEHAVVLCVDEKSQIQALDRRQPVLPMSFGSVEKRTHDYLRHGTTTLFAALDVATGKVIGQCTKRHRATEFLRFLKHIDKNVPTGLDVHLVMDNYATHKTDAVERWLTNHPRFHAHYTPTYSSWLNQVERWFALLTEKQIKRGVHRTITALIRDIQEFIDRSNASPRPFAWTKSADEILASIARFCAKVQKAHART